MIINIIGLAVAQVSFALILSDWVVDAYQEAVIFTDPLFYAGCLGGGILVATWVALLYRTWPEWLPEGADRTTRTLQFTLLGEIVAFMVFGLVVGLEPENIAVLIHIPLLMVVVLVVGPIMV